MTGQRRMLVAGATGYLGGEVVKVAHAAGYRVRALARTEAKLQAVRESCDEVFVGEATRPATLAGAMDGVDVVFSSIGLRSFSRRPTLWEVDCQANLNLVALAQEAGVRDFAFVSLFRGDALRRTLAVAEARERVVDALRASSMRATVVRPNGFFNDMREVFQMAAKGRVWLIGPGTARFNPIHGADIADAVLASLARSGEGAGELSVGGPDVLSLREVGAMAFEALGKPARFGKLPAGLFRAAAGLLKPFNENASTFLSMFALSAEGDLVAPAVGTRHLAEDFRALAASEFESKPRSVAPDDPR